MLVWMWFSYYSSRFQQSENVCEDIGKECIEMLSVLLQIFIAAVTLSSTKVEAATGCFAQGSTYNYDEVLHKSLLFYEAQRSGKLPATQRVTWRKDSALTDAIDDATQLQVNLTGGYYDAGDYVKFGYPMASMTTVLAWGAIDYGTAYTASGEMIYMKEAVKWATDYFIKAHPSANVFFGQVGKGDLDHASCGRPEDMTMYRPAYKLTTTNPGSDLAGETAAALAAASILFKVSNPTYAATCLQHAQQLYNFANQYQGKYANSITDAASYYNSWGVYDDELAWAAAWLYRATVNQTYLTQANGHYAKIAKWVSEFSWAEKKPGVQVLLAEYAAQTDRTTYLNDLKSFCDHIVDNTTKTPKGLVFINEWGSLRYAANAAFICLRAADLGINPTKYRDFGKKQIHYMLGDAGRSYVVGYGNNPPVRPHHKSSSCPLAPAPCDWNTFNSNDPNVHELTGALVGGPNATDYYVDDRKDYKMNEVTTDYNAGFQSAVAALRVLANCSNSTSIVTSTSTSSTKSSATTTKTSTTKISTTAKTTTTTKKPTTTKASTTTKTSTTVKTTTTTKKPTTTKASTTTKAPTTTTRSTTKSTTKATTTTKPPTGSNVTCQSLLSVISAWEAGWNGNVSIPIQTAITSWTVDFEFTAPLTSFEQWTGTTTVYNSTYVSVSKTSSPMSAGSTLTFEILYRFLTGSTVSAIKSIRLNGQSVCNTVATTTPAPPASGSPCIQVKQTSEWQYNYQVDLNVTFPTSVSTWRIVLTFTGAITNINAYTAVESFSGSSATLDNETYNGIQSAGSFLVLGMQITYATSTKPVISASTLNGIFKCIQYV